MLHCPWHMVYLPDGFAITINIGKHTIVPWILRGWREIPYSCEMPKLPKESFAWIGFRMVSPCFRCFFHMEYSTSFVASRQNNCKMLWMLQGTSFSIDACWGVEKYRISVEDPVFRLKTYQSDGSFFLKGKKSLPTNINARGNVFFSISTCCFSRGTFTQESRRILL